MDEREDDTNINLYHITLTSKEKLGKQKNISKNWIRQNKNKHKFINGIPSVQISHCLFVILLACFYICWSTPHWNESGNSNLQH